MRIECRRQEPHPAAARPPAPGTAARVADIAASTAGAMARNASPAWVGSTGPGRLKSRAATSPSKPATERLRKDWVTLGPPPH